MVAWKRKVFRLEEAGPEGSEPPVRDFPLVTNSTIQEAVESNALDDDAALKLNDYVGRRALAVRLVRRYGPLAGKAITVVSVYVPANPREAAEKVKAAFILTVAIGLARIDGEWMAMGDWQAAPKAAWRSSGPE